MQSLFHNKTGINLIIVYTITGDKQYSCRMSSFEQLWTMQTFLPERKQKPGKKIQQTMKVKICEKIFQ